MQPETLAPMVNWTKLAPPGKQAEWLVDRTGLEALIAQRVQQHAVVITAPAGYGKTSLLAQVRRHIAPNAITGWLSLDAGDNDLGHFLLHFVEAIRAGGSHAGQATLALLRSGVGLPPSVLKATLLNELAAIEKNTLLFIDDFHLITDEAVIATVQAILLAPLGHFRLLIATRTAHTLPMSPLRLRNAVLELGGQELRFSAPEVGEFFARQNGSPLAPDVLSLLHERTEGWVAGLQFAAIALRDSSDPQQFLARFSGEHRDVGDFLADEVFGRQSPDVQDFLLATCILKRFDTALCNAVTRQQDARSVLDRLESGNLFIFSLDSEKRWYRYHHLFAEFLQRRLRERQPDHHAELHARACRWLAAHGFTLDAIAHAFAAGDEAFAAELLDTASPHLFATGQFATVQALASRLPPAVAADCPRLQLDLAWDCELRWQFPQARHALRNARATLERWAAEPMDAAAASRHERLMSTLAHREMMLSMLSDDIVATHERSRRWLDADTGTDGFMRASTETAMMLCQRETYCVEGAAAAAEITYQNFVRHGATYGTAFHNSVAGTLLFAAGDLTRAAATYELARDWAVRLHGDKSALVAMPSMLLAELAYERGELDTARRLIQDHSAMSRELGFVDNLIAGFITAARLASAERDPRTAAAVLNDAAHFAERYDFNRLRAHVLAERVRQCMLAGDTREAQRLLVAAGAHPARLLPGAHTTSEHELLAIACARASNDEAALPLMKSWFAHARSRHCVRSAVRCAVLLARLSLRQGQRTAALRQLIEALDLGTDAGFVRSFLDEGDDVIDLLRHLLAHSDVVPTSAQQAAARLLAHVDSQAPASPEAAPEAAAAGALTPREIEILRLAGASMLNSEIGVSLGLAESTVKWYWQKIYEKMGVHRRSLAVQQARRMRLMPPP